MKKAVLMVNSECNAKCNHCYITYTGSRTPEDTLDAVIQLQKQGYGVIIAGSETLMDIGYLKSYKQAEQKYLLTNGILLHQDKSLYDVMQEHGIEQLTFSIHFGIEDKLNPVPERIVAEVLKEAKSRDFKTQITTAITSDNYDNIEEMCDKAAGYGAHEIQFNRFIQSGRGKQHSEYKLTEKQIEEFFEQIKLSKKKYRKDMLIIKPHGNFGPRHRFKGKKISDKNDYCPAGKELFAIDPHDNVYGCPFIMEPNAKIGQYIDGQIVVDKVLLPDKRNQCIIDAVLGQ